MGSKSVLATARSPSDSSRVICGTFYHVNAVKFGPACMRTYLQTPSEFTRAPTVSRMCDARSMDTDSDGALRGEIPKITTNKRKE